MVLFNSRLTVRIAHLEAEGQPGSCYQLETLNYQEKKVHRKAPRRRTT